MTYTHIKFNYIFDAQTPVQQWAHLKKVKDLLKNKYISLITQQSLRKELF